MLSRIHWGDPLILGFSLLQDIKIFFLSYLFWLPWVLVVVCGLLTFGVWDLVPQPKIEPKPTALGYRVLAAGPPGKSPCWEIFDY